MFKQFVILIYEDFPRIIFRFLNF